MIEAIVSILMALIKVPLMIVSALLKMLLFPVHVLANLLVMALCAAFGAWLASRLRLSPVLGAVLGIFGPPGIVILIVIGLVAAAQRG
ncbi:MAG: hypothetical protein ACUVTZ_07975 [Armatimonadota bacterium]